MRAYYVLADKYLPHGTRLRRKMKRQSPKTKRPLIKKHKRRSTKKREAAHWTANQYFAKPEKFKNTWERVINVVGKMRNEKISLRKASREVGISAQTVRRLGGSALQKRTNGKFVA